MIAGRSPGWSFIRRLEGVHRVSLSLLGPVDPSFRALSGRLKFTVRRHKFNKDSFSPSSGRVEELLEEPREQQPGS